jgi:hypothetical protein
VNMKKQRTTREMQITPVLEVVHVMAGNMRVLGISF